MLVWLLAMLAVVAHAAASFTVQAPRQVAAGNKFNVTFVLRNAEGSNFHAPEVDGATKIYGPGKSTSYSTSWVNGKTSSSSSEEYTMLYKAGSAGRLHIGAASIVVDGKTLYTNPVTIDVVDGGSSQRDEDDHPRQRGGDARAAGRNRGTIKKR